ncbi:MAG: hypothetical protein HDS59_01420 [Barnesiella sp.]|nr:hypothetical protein [Barnesiella sp.]
MLQQLLSYHKANSKIPIHQLSIPNPGVFSTKISHFKCPGAMSRTGEASLSDSSKFSEFSDSSENGAFRRTSPLRLFRFIVGKPGGVELVFHSLADFCLII